MDVYRLATYDDFLGSDPSLPCDAWFAHKGFSFVEIFGGFLSKPSEPQDDGWYCNVAIRMRWFDVPTPETAKNVHLGGHEGYNFPWKRKMEKN